MRYNTETSTITITSKAKYNGRLTYEEAQKFCIKNKIRNEEEYSQLEKLYPNDLPLFPEIWYVTTGWLSWHEFLKPILSEFEYGLIDYYFNNY